MTTNNTQENKEAILNQEVVTTEVMHEVEEAKPVHEVTIYAEPLFHIGKLEVTNSLLTSWLAVLVIIIFSLIIRINLKKIPGKLQHVFEIILGGALSLVDQVTNDRKISNKIFPVVFSIFIFILINNWVGILPFIGSVGYYTVHDGHNVFIPFFRGGTADINTTLTLGIVAVLGSNIFGIITLGAWKTLNKYVKLQELGSIFTKVRKDPSVLVVAPISFFVGIIEFIGEIAKIASLSFRLFGNIFAGEVLLSSMAAILAFVLPTPFLFLEVFIGLIQALIFALLTTVYFTIAAQDHSEHEEHGESKSHDSKKGELVHT
jgi:F-type H+-transporting ATPase subunit a